MCTAAANKHGHGVEVLVSRHVSIGAHKNVDITVHDEDVKILASTSRYIFVLISTPISAFLIICFLPCLGKDWLDLLDACIFMEIFLFFSKQCNGSFAGILIIESWQKLLHIATRYIQGVQTWTSFSSAITVVDGLTFFI